MWVFSRDGIPGNDKTDFATIFQHCSIKNKPNHIIGDTHSILSTIKQRMKGSVMAEKLESSTNSQTN